MSFLPHSHPPRATTVNSLTCTLPEFFYLSPFKCQQEGVNCKEEASFSPGFLTTAIKGVGKVSPCNPPLDSRAPKVLYI